MSLAVAIGTFDGVHLGHRRVIEAALETGLPVRVLTLHPHPRTVVQGNQVELLTTIERRVELIQELGVAETVVLEFTLERASQEPEDFAATELAGASVVVAGEDFRFGHRRRGDLELLAAARVRGAGRAAARGRVVVGDPAPPARGRRPGGRAPARSPAGGRRDRRPGRPARGDARLPDGEPRGRSRPARAALRDLRRRRRSAIARRSRSARTRTTAARSGGSSRTCSTSRATSTAGGSSSSCGSGCATSRSFESEQALVDQIARDVEATRQATRPGLKAVR